ncbi:MAG: UbiH/UbiF/VisC/COQ6 family ubiquinone biosynthesis hydroxylase [Gammaproteobacteria bacterium]
MSAAARPQKSDLVVVGGGMVGLAAACLLARSGFSVALVEAAPPEPVERDPQADYALRVSALSPGSAAILDQCGAWADIEAGRSCPYQRMTVEDRDADAAVEFEAPAFGLERLGTIVENDLVRDALWRSAMSEQRIQRFCPARVEHVEQDREAARVRLEDGRELQAELLLACDGGRSPLRAAVGARSQTWEYNQCGLVCTVRKSLPNPGTAWQRFLPGGPLAFLPLEDGRSSIVWTLPTEDAQRLLEVSDETFTAALRDASEGWLGAVEAVGPRAAFPLSMRISDRFRAGRTVLLGDAAHVVHPLAGQGVNLGFADVAALVEVLAAQRSRGRALADVRALQRFERWRRSETGLMAAGIHVLQGLFRPDALAPLRRLGMRQVADSWMLREAFLQRAAGTGPNAPRLARGESLRALSG